MSGTLFVEEPKLEDISPMREFFIGAVAEEMRYCGVTQRDTELYLADWQRRNPLDVYEEYWLGDSSPGRFSRVVRAGEGIAGLLRGELLPAGECGVNQINLMYLEESKRGTGTADRLMRVVLSHANPAAPTQLKAFALNTRARRFYGRHQFSQFNAAFAIPLGEGYYPVVTMQRPANNESNRKAREQGQ